MIVDSGKQSRVCPRNQKPDSWYNRKRRPGAWSRQGGLNQKSPGKIELGKCQKQHLRLIYCG